MHIARRQHLWNSGDFWRVKREKAMGWLMARMGKKSYNMLPLIQKHFGKKYLDKCVCLYGCVCVCVALKTHHTSKWDIICTPVTRTDIYFTWKHVVHVSEMKRFEGMSGRISVLPYRLLHKENICLQQP